MPERLKPSYDLGEFQTWALSDQFSVTRTALLTALALGLTSDDMVEIIGTIQKEHFYKSMTSHSSSLEWQDVYRVPSGAGLLYVKFRADSITEFHLLSFKEK